MCILNYVLYKLLCIHRILRSRSVNIPGVLTFYFLSTSTSHLMHRKMAILSEHYCTNCVIVRK